MTVQAIVSDNRVILADNASKADLEAAKAEHPGKSIIRASSLRVVGNEIDNRQMADMQRRMNKLETIVAQLLAEKHAAVKTVVISAPEDEQDNEPEIETIEEPEVVEARPVRKLQAAPPKAKAPAKEGKPNKVNYDDWDIGKLTRVALKRGCNVEKVLAGKWARGRNKALVNWLRANPKSKQA